MTVLLAIAIQGCALLIAWIWHGSSLAPLLEWSPLGLLGIPAGLGMLGVSLVLMRFGGRDVVERILDPVVRALGWHEVVIISILSGCCEEILFRGVAQPAIGILPSSLIFGILHTGRRELIP